jgi:hypothetical protein
LPIAKIFRAARNCPGGTKKKKKPHRPSQPKPTLVDEPAASGQGETREKICNLIFFSGNTCVVTEKMRQQDHRLRLQVKWDARNKVRFAPNSPTRHGHIFQVPWKPLAFQDFTK